MSELAGVIGELRDIAGVLRERELIRMVEGATAVAACLREIRSEAQDDLIALCTALPPLTQLNDAGPTPPSWRELYPQALLASDPHRRWATEASRTGRRIRTLTAIPAALTLADTHSAVVLVPTPATERAVHIRDTALVQLLRQLSEDLWRCALPITTPAPPPHQSLSRRQQAIAHMLADGLKDEAIARHLGLSLRTVRKEISTLTEALCATSRFQAGARFAATLLRDLPE